MRRLVTGDPYDTDIDLDAAYWVAEIESPDGQLVVGAMISSVDGAVTRNGRSGGLGSRADTQLFALLRAHAEVLLVGSRTVLAEGYGGDRPDAAGLAIRHRHGLGDVARIAVVSGSLDLDPDGPIFTDTALAPIVLTTASSPADRRRALSDRAEVVIVGDDRVDLARALDALRDRGFRRISCEGGPTVLGQVAAAGRLSELAFTLAPLLLGGAAARILTGPALSPPITLERVHVLTDDEGYLFLRYRLRP